METADRNLNALVTKALGEIHRAGELVGLHADQADNAAPARACDLARNSFGAHARVGLVDGVDCDLDVLAEDAPRAAILR